MDTDKNLRYCIYALVAFLLYGILAKPTLENFVPYNSYKIPRIDKTDEIMWKDVRDRLTQLVNLVNTRKWSLSYDMDKLEETLQQVLDASGLGKIQVTSVGGKSSLSLTDVTAIDKQVMMPFKLDRVDFMVDSMNPFIITQVTITPSPVNVPNPDETIAVFSGAYDNSQFRIKNKLGLFYPYPTSDNDMKITGDVIDKHLEVMKAKEIQSKLMFETSTPTQPAPQALI